MNVDSNMFQHQHVMLIPQDERTNQNVKRALRRYINEAHDDWDIHLQAIVYGINTAKQVMFYLWIIWGHIIVITFFGH